jgi:hypothetical protein
VRELVALGMDCMRINCSYDGRPARVAMGEHLKRAKRFIDARGSSRRMVVTGASGERVEDPLRDESPFRLEMAWTGSLAGPVAGYASQYARANRSRRSQTAGWPDGKRPRSDQGPLAIGQ